MCYCIIEVSITFEGWGVHARDVQKIGKLYLCCVLKILGDLIPVILLKIKGGYILLKCMSYNLEDEGCCICMSPL